MLLRMLLLLSLSLRLDTNPPALDRATAGWASTRLDDVVQALSQLPPRCRREL